MKVLGKESPSHFPSLAWALRFLWDEEKPAKEGAPGIPKSTGFGVSALKRQVGHPRQPKTKGRASEVGRRDQPRTKGHICLIQLKMTLGSLVQRGVRVGFCFLPYRGSWSQTLAVAMGLVVGDGTDTKAVMPMEGHVCKKTEGKQSTL